MNRAQASITVIEAAIGVLLLTSITFLFAIDHPGDDEARTEAQLDVYADDAATLLVHESPRHADQTRLSEVMRSAETFDREKEALEHRIERILPPNVMFRVETAYGSVGYRLPGNVRTGETTILTPNGEVRLRVWYA